MKLNYLTSSWNLIDYAWQEFLQTNCSSQLTGIDRQLCQISEHQLIYPPAAKILRALHLNITQIKIVILGQDPYHGTGEANGLAFAVDSGVKLPPSLRNILKELSLEYNSPGIQYDGSLLNSWSNQGVLLLNTTLTVIKDQANSMAKLGWHEITDQIIHQISQQNQHCVFMLWGNFARNKKTLIDDSKHLILEAVHPSPLSANRGFFGCNHFKQANQFLLQSNLAPINWLPDNG